MAFYWIQSAYNLSDMLSKHWDHPETEKKTVKEGALLATRSIANVEMIWTWILSSSIRRKPPVRKKHPLWSQSDATRRWKN